MVDTMIDVFEPVETYHTGYRHGYRDGIAMAQLIHAGHKEISDLCRENRSLKNENTQYKENSAYWMRRSNRLEKRLETRAKRK
jgi:hypothetical protein